MTKENSLLKVHLDTDIGGDIDDLCALAMVLNWPAAYVLDPGIRQRVAAITQQLLGGV